MKVSLTVGVPGDMEGKQIPITLPEFLIGRDPECHLCPGSPRVGKRHCALLLRKQKVFLRNFDITSGTYVNDRRVDGEIQLLDGDWLKIGPLLFRLNVEDAPAGLVHHEDLAAELLLEELPSSADSTPAQANAPTSPPPPAEPPPKPPSAIAQAIREKYRRRGRA